MSSTLRCANGSRWSAKGCGPCVKCQREADALNRAFWRAVFFGEYNRTGYTEAEWITAGKPRETWRQSA